MPPITAETEAPFPRWQVTTLSSGLPISSPALALTNLYPIQQGVNPETYGTAYYYTGCGMYRITSVMDTEIQLEPNPYWSGNSTELELVRCVPGS